MQATIESIEAETLSRFDKIANRLPWISVENYIHEGSYSCHPKYRTRLALLFNRIQQKVVKKHLQK